jgi:chaperonin GroEL (HSP60 family)
LENGITNISRIDDEKMENISEILSTNIHCSVEYLTTDSTAQCELFEEKEIENERYCIIKNQNKRFITLVLRGPTDDILKEAKRSLEDAIFVASNFIESNNYFLLGAGATEL